MVMSDEMHFDLQSVYFFILFLWSRMVIAGVTSSIHASYGISQA